MPAKNKIPPVPLPSGATAVVVGGANDRLFPLTLVAAADPPPLLRSALEA